MSALDLKFKSFPVANYELSRITAEQYKKWYDEIFHKVFRRRINFSSGMVTQQPSDIVYLALFHQGVPVGIFNVFTDPELNALVMNVSVIHPEHRLKGLYRGYTDVIIDASKQAGYDCITSTHSPTNTPILIAKMKAGFMFGRFQITPTYGTEVGLIYFHNKAMEQAFRFRCGDLTVPKASPELYAGFGEFRDFLSHAIQP